LNNISKYLLPFISIIAILAFLVMYGIAIIDTWTSIDQTPAYSGAFQYIATALCGLVGGITAKGLGQAYTPITGASIQSEKNKSLFSRRMIALSSIVSPFDSEKVRTWIASFYMIAFIIFGLAAALTWVFRESVTPEMVKNLAMIVIGLIIPSMQSFLTTDKAAEKPS